VILRRQLAQRCTAGRIDEGKMGMALDQAGHQELARRVDAFGAVRRHARRLRRHRGNPLAVDQHLARKGRRTRSIPHHGVVNQQPHCFLAVVFLAYSGQRNSVARRRPVP
jgi:hypothetical protein